MKFKAEIDVMPHEALLDPQGKAVCGSMGNIGLANVQDVRIGKHITIKLEASDLNEANEQVEKACKQLLANLIMESYTYSVKEI